MNTQLATKQMMAAGVEFFIVGGYVRDRILGIESNDHDFVVVGATVQQMLDAGFEQVGADFPVFLNENGDEFALARVERKVSAGHTGFDMAFGTNVTLEQDLVRRDVTMNSMARRVIGWNDRGHAKLDDHVIDPFGGRNSIARQQIQHTSPAFAEDPLRVMRVARLAAKTGFGVSRSTMLLMEQVINSPDFLSLSKERIWVEIDKAMSEQHYGPASNRNPLVFWNILNAIGGFQVLRIPFHTSMLKKDTMSITGTHNWMAGALKHTQPHTIIQWLQHDLSAPNNLVSFCVDIANAHQFLERASKRGITSDDVVVLLNEKLRTKNQVVLMAEISFLQVNGWDSIMRKVKECVDVKSTITFKSLTENEQQTLTGKDIGLRISQLQDHAVSSTFNELNNNTDWSNR